MRATLLLLVSTVVFAGCSEPTSPEDVLEPQLTKDCTFFNCGEDPDPEAGGILLGSGFTPTYCFAAASDTDQDGLDNVCEEAMADAFRPEIVSGSTDDTRGEAHWAARRIGTTNRVRIAYLLGYYWDWGSPRSLCAIPVFPPSGDCGGHIGDSEWVAVDIEYSSGGRWVMAQAGLSAHFGTGNDHTAWVSWTGFHFPENERGYPRVYASLKKHANYQSVSRCNANIIPDGFETFDDCSYSSAKYERVEYVPSRNIGSRTRNARSDGLLGPGTCRYSTETFAGSEIAECFWLSPSGYHFNGWQESNDPVGPYEPQLAFLGF